MLETAKRSIYQVDIEKEFGLRPPTVTETLKSLEKKDLIRRIPDENDGRKKKIIITEKTLSMDDGVKCQVEKSEKVFAARNHKRRARAIYEDCRKDVT